MRKQVRFVSSIFVVRLGLGRISGSKALVATVVALRSNPTRSLNLTGTSIVRVLFFLLVG